MEAMINEYIQQVLSYVDADASTKERLRQDLQSHLYEACQGKSAQDLLPKLGDPKEMAADLIDTLYDDKRDIIRQLIQARAQAAQPNVYEYKSSSTLFGLPLVHINLTRGNVPSHRPRVARGILAIGDIAIGVVALGAIALGGISIGALSLGLLSLGGLALGLLGALGGLAAGMFAFGGVAIGYMAFGGAAVGLYAFGGAVYASRIGMGDAVKAPIAFLIHEGEILVRTDSALHTFQGLNELAELKALLYDQFKHISHSIIDTFIELWKSVS